MRPSPADEHRSHAQEVAWLAHNPDAADEWAPLEATGVQLHQPSQPSGVALDSWAGDVECVSDLDADEAAVSD